MKRRRHIMTQMWTCSLEVEGDQRLRFKFSGAQLKLPKRTVPLPPFGQGW